MAMTDEEILAAIDTGIEAALGKDGAITDAIAGAIADAIATGVAEGGDIANAIRRGVARYLKWQPDV
jgi:hypothetical protein